MRPDPREVARATRRRQWRIAVARHRRLLSAGLAAAAVAVALPVLAPEPAGVEQVAVAGRDLPAGHTLAAGDVRQASWASGTAPDGALRAGEATGVSLASPLRRGEPVTDARVVGPGLLAGTSQAPGAARVGAPVRLSDPPTAALLSAGDLVDVLGGPVADALVLDEERDGERAERLARRAVVLAVPRGGGGLLGDASSEQGLVVLAVSEREAAALAAAAGVRTVGVVLVR